jgi:hypothetical protein
MDPEKQVQVELIGNEFEDGDLLDLDGDVGVRLQWVDPMRNVVVVKAVSNEVE